jgi:hypothetical protein
MRVPTRSVQGVVLAGLLALSGAGRVDASLVDAVLGQVGSATVAASDIALARALGLFGFTPSEAPIDAADVDRYAEALVAVLEASRLGIGPTEVEIEQAWRVLEGQQGGGVALQAWFDAVAIDAAWVRRALEAHLRWRAWQDVHARLSAPPPDLAIRRLLPPGRTEPVPFPMPAPPGS